MNVGINDLINWVSIEFVNKWLNKKIIFERVI